MIDKEPESNPKMCVRSNGGTRWRKKESTNYVTSISVRNTGTQCSSPPSEIVLDPIGELSTKNTGTRVFFFNAVFNHFPVEDFCQTNGESIIRCLKSPFLSKTQNRQIA